MSSCIRTAATSHRTSPAPQTWPVIYDRGHCYEQPTRLTDGIREGEAEHSLRRWRHEQPRLNLARQEPLAQVVA